MVLMVLTAMVAITMLAFLLPNGQQAAAEPAKQAMPRSAGKITPEPTEKAAPESAIGASDEPKTHFIKGDVFAAVGRYIYWYREDGTFVERLDTGQPGGRMPVPEATTRKTPIPWTC